MSTPLFISFFSDGEVWLSKGSNTVPTPTSGGATLLGTFRVLSEPAEQKLTTLSGTVSSNLALPASGAGAPNGRYGRDIT